MSRTLRLLGLAGVLIFPIAVPAQEELEDEFALLEEEISVDEVESASKRRQSIFWSPSAITVFTREDIRASGASNLPDLLRRVPGFDVYELKPSFPLVGARALTETSNNLVLLLVDGREAVIELAGFPMWSATTVDLEEIERVEVIRGPGSTLYGANAFAAVVNITTMADRGFSADVLASAGEQGQQRFAARAGSAWEVGDGTLDFSLSLGTEGRCSPSDRRNQFQDVQLRSHGWARYREGQKLDVSLHGGFTLGAGTMFMISGDFIADPVTNHYVMGQAEFALGEDWRLKAQLYHIRFTGKFHYRTRFVAYGEWLADVPDFHMDTNTVDAKVQVDFRASEALLLIGGLNSRFTSHESDRIIPFETTEIRGAGFVHAQWQPWEAVQLTAGLRLDLNSRTTPALSPRAVVVVRPVDNHAFRLGYGLAFRKPAFTENQMHLQVDEVNPAFPEVNEKLARSIGNQDLVNEKVHSLEAGWRTHFLQRRLRASVDLFYNVYVDMITFESEMTMDELGRPNISDSTFQFKNQADNVTALGGEAELAWTFLEDWTLWGNLGLRWVTDAKGDRLPAEPRLRANLGARWNPAPETLAIAPVVDIALHYVTTHHQPLVHYNHPFGEPELYELGDALLLVGRVGVSLPAGRTGRWEAGLTVRTPLGLPFREYAGIEMRRTTQSVTASDFVGEELVRLISFYLRGSFW